jgi:uncharacterized protein (DUF2267 family)/CBS domain-containing protein
MSTTGLEIFDRSIHTTNIWLKEIAEAIGADRRTAWHALGAVLRALRDRLPANDAAHLSAQLPLLVRGTFYEQYRPAIQPDAMRSREEFVRRVADGLEDGRPVDAEAAIEAVLSVLQRHITKAETAKVRQALPEHIRRLWRTHDDKPKGGGGSMKVAEVMTRDVQMASPDDTLQEVAKRMVGDDVGFLPVRENDRLVGTITDRDIVARAVAQGKGGQARVREVMTPDVKYCFEDEDVEHVVQNMGDIQVRRLPVVDRNKRLVGVISLADVARKHDPSAVGVAMTGVVEPGGAHATH